MAEVSVCWLLAVRAVTALDMPPVGRIVIFGDMQLEGAVRELLPSVPVSLTDDTAEKLQKTLAASRLWRQSNLSWVCCEPDGTAILYVGVRSAKSNLRFRRAPEGSIRLDSEDLASYERLMDLNHEAVTKGQASQDNAGGEALSDYAPARVVQEEVIARSRVRAAHWRKVALQSADRLHRAAAVHLAPYGAKDKELVHVLATAAQDPDPLVRNNAVRAIGVLASSEIGRPLVRLRPGPLLDLFQSVHWTDWNKASFALAALTDTADARLLREIGRRAMGPLQQMAGWPAGHASAAKVILDRIRMNEAPHKN